MAEIYYKSNGEKVKCVNCGNTEFTRRDPVNGQKGMTPYECDCCHFISWFASEHAPEEEPSQN